MAPGTSRAATALRWPAHSAGVPAWKLASRLAGYSAYADCGYHVDGGGASDT
jgi:hypothetical protein